MWMSAPAIKVGCNYIREVGVGHHILKNHWVVRQKEDIHRCKMHLKMRPLEPDLINHIMDLGSVNLSLVSSTLFPVWSGSTRTPTNDYSLYRIEIFSCQKSVKNLLFGEVKKQIIKGVASVFFGLTDMNFKNYTALKWQYMVSLSMYCL